jgi:hypothetical protein
MMFIIPYDQPLPFKGRGRGRVIPLFKNSDKEKSKLHSKFK